MKKNEFEFEFGEFHNLGFIGLKLSEEQLKPIRNEVETIRKNFKGHLRINKELAGNIEHEYELNKCKSHIFSILMPLMAQYIERWGVFNKIGMLTNDVPMTLSSLWVNFQKKHEFNPPHVHQGLASFVIWLDTPFSIEDELNTLSSKDAAIKIPGHFQFLYTDSQGHIRQCNMPVDKTWNGRMVIFPSTMVHAVYPFSTSDEYRISISGNIKLDTSRSKISNYDMR